VTIVTCGLCRRPIILRPHYEGSRWEHVDGEPCTPKAPTRSGE
jgi:hypothetical protein